MKKYSIFLLCWLTISGSQLGKDIHELIQMEHNEIRFETENLNSLRQRLKLNQSQEIIHIGDSHIQMGDFSVGFLKILQENNISANQGWIFPSGIFSDLFSSEFRVKKQSQAFETQNIRNNTSSNSLGISGRSFLLHSAQNVIYIKSKNPILTLELLHDNSENVYITPGNGKQKCFKNVSILHEIQSKYTITNLFFQNGVKNFSLNFQKKSEQPIAFYGVRLNHQENKVNYSNFGVSGATFEHFWNAPQLYDQLEVLHPTLIFVTLGTNDSYLSNLDTIAFKTRLSTFTRSVRERLPKAEMIFMTAPDTRYTGTYPPALDFINRTMRNHCKEQQIAFWDWHALMGGKNSMEKWQTNGFTAGDNLHFSPIAYQFFGKLFAKALLEINPN